MKISCDVCQDLIPIVKDDIASNDSKNLVLDHIKECQFCKEAYGDNVEKPTYEDRAIIKDIRKKVYKLGLLILVGTTLFGTAMTNSQGVFYNFLIMPLVGIIGYWVLKPNWIVVVPFVFVTSGLWNFFAGIITENMGVVHGLQFGMIYGGVYTFLAAIGILIGLLLAVAFKKENKDEKDI